MNRFYYTLFTFQILLLFFSSVQAQQDPQFSQYMFNRLYYNPAYAGSENGINTTGIFRNQWVGFPGHPITGVLSVDAPINKINSGIGGVFSYDQYGRQKIITAKTAYNYKVKTKKGIVSFGIDAGLFNEQFDTKNLTYNNQYPVNANDLAIPKDKINVSAIDFSGGFYYSTEKFYAGLSCTHITQSKINKGNFFYYSARHYYFTTGYKFSLSENVSLQPSLFIKSDGASKQIDLNTTLFCKYFWLGAGYRLQDAVVLLAGLKLKGFLLGYSYDYTTSILRNYETGSHEITLRYLVKPKQKQNESTNK